MSDDIKLLPCSGCGGQPVVLIRPAWPHPALQVQCMTCGHSGPWVFFASEDLRIFQMADHVLLPRLAKAREEAAAAWNEEWQP